jgi:hypothetical protein
LSVARTAVEAPRRGRGQAAGTIRTQGQVLNAALSP